ALLEPRLHDVEQIRISQEDQYGHHEVDRASAPRVLIGERYAEQHQVDRHERQARAPGEFGQVIARGVAQQRGRGEAGRGWHVDDRLMRDLHAVVLEFHDAEVGLAGLAVVAPAVFQDDEARTI